MNSNTEIPVANFQFSEPCGATTQAVVPGQCQAPKVQGKPKATSLHLRWGMWSFIFI